MTYSNPKLERLRQQFPFWRMLHQLLEGGAIMATRDPQVRPILESNPAFSTQPVETTLRDIAAERQRIGYKLIDRQEALAEAGIMRAKALHEQFDYYAHGILKGAVGAAKTDLGQQAHDVAIMFTLSHTQLMFARQYAKPDDPVLQSYEHRVTRQEKRMQAFTRLRLPDQPRYYDYADTLSDAAKAAFVQHFEDCTLDVANSNIALCEQVGELVQNKIRMVHYWRWAVESGRMPAAVPVERQAKEIKFEADLLRIYIRRCEILEKRGAGIYDLSGKVADMMLDDLPDPPNFGWA